MRKKNTMEIEVNHRNCIEFNGNFYSVPWTIMGNPEAIIDCMGCIFPEISRKSAIVEYQELNVKLMFTGMPSVKAS